MEYRCYRCGKEAKFFFENEKSMSNNERYFYNDSSYWSDLPTYYTFVCDKCLILRVSISKLEHEEVVLMKKMAESDRDYIQYFGTLNEYINLK